jgi:hypothetical protein
VCAAYARLRDAIAEVERFGLGRDPVSPALARTTE